jgi:hypothetical protein
MQRQDGNQSGPSKKISNDLIRQSQMDACVFDNDATACYD